MSQCADCVPMSLGGVLIVLTFSAVCALFALRYRWTVFLSLPLLFGWRQVLEGNNQMPEWALIVAVLVPIAGAIAPRRWLRPDRGAPA